MVVSVPGVLARLLGDHPGDRGLRPALAGSAGVAPDQELADEQHGERDEQHHRGDGIRRRQACAHFSQPDGR